MRLAQLVVLVGVMLLAAGAVKDISTADERFNRAMVAVDRHDWGSNKAILQGRVEVESPISSLYGVGGVVVLMGLGAYLTMWWSRERDRRELVKNNT